MVRVTYGHAIREPRNNLQRYLRGLDTCCGRVVDAYCGRVVDVLWTLVVDVLRTCCGRVL